MKKLLLIIAMALAAVSCEKVIDRETIVEKPNIRVLNYTVSNTGSPHRWEWSEDANGYNGHYYCNISIPELNNYIFSNGMITAYLIAGNNQEMLPSTIWLDDGQGSLWEQTINCNFAPGRISFYFATSDFIYMGNDPGTRNFRVVLSW